MKEQLSKKVDYLHQVLGETRTHEVALGDQRDVVVASKIENRRLADQTRLNDNDIRKIKQDKMFLENELFRCRAEISAIAEQLKMKTTVVERQIDIQITKAEHDSTYTKGR